MGNKPKAEKPSEKKVLDRLNEALRREQQAQRDVRNYPSR